MAEPRLEKSKIDILDPILDSPNIEMLEPRRV